MNDVFFSQWHRLTPEKKIRNSPVNRSRASDVSSSALYNITFSLMVQSPPGCLNW